MFYRYHARHMPTSRWSRQQGWTRYRGDLVSEMVAEMPTRGHARLERKLSLDIYCLIPLLWQANIMSRVTMNLVAWDLATKHGCRLRPAHRLEPAAPKPSWLEWLQGLLGFAPRIRPEDEESGGEKERLIDEGWEEEEESRKGPARHRPCITTALALQVSKWDGCHTEHWDSLSTGKPVT